MDDVEMRPQFANNLEYLEIWAPKIPSLATPDRKGEDSWRNDIYFNDSKLLESLRKEKRHDTQLDGKMNTKWVRNEYEMNSIMASLTP